MAFYEIIADQITTLGSKILIYFSQRFFCQFSSEFCAVWKSDTQEMLKNAILTAFYSKN